MFGRKNRETINNLIEDVQKPFGSADRRTANEAFLANGAVVSAGLSVLGALEAGAALAGGHDQAAVGYAAAAAIGTVGAKVAMGLRKNRLGR